jgi:hypothetical protein
MENGNQKLKTSQFLAVQDYQLIHKIFDTRI